MRAITAKGVYTRKLEEASSIHDDTIIKTERGKEMYCQMIFEKGYVDISISSITAFWERRIFVYYEDSKYIRHEGIRHIPMPIKAFLSELGMEGIQ